MNSLNSALIGLLSSLLLSLGFSRLAACFDQLDQATATHPSGRETQLLAAKYCAMPCRWQEV